MSAPHWTERPEGGGRRAIWLIRFVALYGGRTLARVFLYPIAFYFFLRRKPERTASYAYLERVTGRRPHWWQVVRHIWYFASTILDRVFLLADRLQKFDVRVWGLDELHAQLRPDRGIVLLGAHVGSFEVLRVLAEERPDIKVRVVLDKQQTPALTELLHALNPTIANGVIDGSRSGTDIVLALGEALHEGAITALLADRARPHEATATVDFLGSPARFPTAPFLIAAALKVPVVMCFGLYRGGRRYDLHFETLSDAVEVPRRERQHVVRGWVERYAARLEHHVRSAPYNWFNYFDFWNLDAPIARDQPADAHAAVRGGKP